MGPCQLRLVRLPDFLPSISKVTTPLPAGRGKGVGPEYEIFAVIINANIYRNKPFGTLSFQHVGKLLVEIAIQTHTWQQVVGHHERKDAMAFHSVHTKTYQSFVAVEEAETVAIGNLGSWFHHHALSLYRHTAGQRLANSLGRIKRKDIVVASIEEIVGEAAIERLPHIGLELQLHLSVRGSSVFLRILSTQTVEGFAVGCRHVLHIRHILQSSLNLERTGACLSQILQRIQLTQVLQRKQVLVLLILHTLLVLQIELHATNLRTFSSVGTTSEQSFAGVALSAETHT